MTWQVIAFCSIGSIENRAKLATKVLMNEKKKEKKRNISKETIQHKKMQSYGHPANMPLCDVIEGTTSLLMPVQRQWHHPGQGYCSSCWNHFITTLFSPLNIWQVHQGKWFFLGDCRYRVKSLTVLKKKWKERASGCIWPADAGRNGCKRLCP